MRSSSFFIRLAAALVVAAAFAPARAQQPPPSGSIAGPGALADSRLQIVGLDRLASRASESVDVNIDEQLLSILPRILDPNKPEEAKAREVISGLKGIYVRSYTFEAEGAYAEADVAPIRGQLRAPGWARIVGISNTKEKKNVEVYVRAGAGGINGMAILNLEPKQLTVINIVGSIDLAKLRQLEGKYGIPELGVEEEKGNRPKK